MLGNQEISELELSRKGYQVLGGFVSKDKTELVLEEIFEKETQSEAYRPDRADNSKPFVTIFVAGFRDEQIIVPIDQCKHLSTLVKKAADDINRRFDPEVIFAYEITVFKKRQGSPALELHQDAWYHPFELSENKFEYLSYYIPLTSFDKATSQLGLISWEHIDLNVSYQEKHIIDGTALHKQNEKQELTFRESDIEYPVMNSGDCCIFEIRSPHNSAPHDIAKDRYALSIRFGTTWPKLSKIGEARANFVKQLKQNGFESFLWLKGKP